MQSKAHETPPQVQLRMLLRYDGRAYRGWQRQPGFPTVQGTLEAAIAEVVDLELTIRGSGRTDRGAHAEGQVATVTLPKGCVPSIGGFLDNLRAALPDDIEALEIDRVPLDFHVREDAIGKRYRYEIWNGGSCPAELSGRAWEIRRVLEIDAMRAVLPVFVGRHDFSSFATRSNYERASSVREVRSFELEEDRRRVTLEITADGFLYKMVRNIVRAVAKVGEGRGDKDRLTAVLKARDRSAAPGSAPASGLYLDEVFYPRFEELSLRGS